jgi:hypothetical protein
MANIRGELKRAFLQSLFDAVVDGNASVDLASGVDANLVQVLTFESALKAFQRLQFNSLKEGKLTIMNSGMEHEIRFAGPDILRAMSQEEVFSMAQEFREVFDDSLVTLSAAGDSDPDDRTILRAMMANDRLQSVTSTQRDFSMLRFNSRR